MATDAEVAALGFELPQGQDLITNGDDAIRKNAHAAYNSRWSRGKLPTGLASFNQLVTPGTYELSSEDASRLSDGPDAATAGSITVLSNGGSGITQQFTMNNGWDSPRALMRSGAQNGTAFGPWVAMTDIPTPLTSGVALSSVTAPGQYTAPSAAVSKGIPDAPDAVSGMPFILQVSTSRTSSTAFRCIQKITTLPYTAGQPAFTFTRTLTNSGEHVGWQEGPELVRLSAEHPTGHRTEALRNASRLRRGGRIHTGGATPLAISFDHGFGALRDKLLPTLARLGLPATLAINTATMGTGENAGVAYGDVQSWALSHGFEVAHHGRSHSDIPFASTNLTGLADHLVGTQAVLAEQLPQLICDAFIMPGISGQQLSGFNAGVPYRQWWEHPAGRLILEHFPVVSSLTPGELWPATGEPAMTQARIGLDTSSWVAKARTVIAAATGSGMAAHVYLHPALLDTDGHTSSSAAIAFLEWVAAERDAGRIEPLTMSGLAWASPTTGPRMNLLRSWSSRQASFEVAPRIAWARGAQVVIRGTATAPGQLSVTSDAGGLSTTRTYAAGPVRLAFTIPATASQIAVTSTTDLTAVAAHIV